MAKLLSWSSSKIHHLYSTLVAVQSAWASVVFPMTMKRRHEFKLCLYVEMGWLQICEMDTNEFHFYHLPAPVFRAQQEQHLEN